MATSIICPTCRTSIPLDREAAEALCPDCGHLDDGDLAALLQKRLDAALWAALRALEDKETYAQWAVGQGRPAPLDAEQVRESSRLLRAVLTPRT